MMKLKEDLKCKKNTKTGDKFLLKSSIRAQDSKKRKKLLLNGILFSYQRVVKLMEHYKDQKSLHKRYTLQLIEKCKEIV